MERNNFCLHSPKCGVATPSGSLWPQQAAPKPTGSARKPHTKQKLATDAGSGSHQEPRSGCVLSQSNLWLGIVSDKYLALQPRGRVSGRNVLSDVLASGQHSQSFPPSVYRLSVLLDIKESDPSFSLPLSQVKSSQNPAPALSSAAGGMC